MQEQPSREAAKPAADELVAQLERPADRSVVHVQGKKDDAEIVVQPLLLRVLAICGADF